MLNAAPAFVLALLLAGAAPAFAAKPAPAGSATTVIKKAPVGKKATARKTRVARKPAPRSIVLYHINTRESLRLRFVDDQGKAIAGMQRRVNRFFRCHHSRKQGRMHPRLLRLLFQTGRHFGGKRIEVVSGYRHPQVSKNPHSPHMKGFACDFRVKGVKNGELRDYLRQAFKKIGVGYYPNSSFVHLDVRPGASAFWIDYSAPGESSFYSDSPGEDLKTGRAEGFKPAHIDPSWAEPVPPASGAGSQPPSSPRRPARSPAPAGRDRT